VPRQSREKLEKHLKETMISSIELYIP